MNIIKVTWTEKQQTEYLERTEKFNMRDLSLDDGIQRMYEFLTIADFLGLRASLPDGKFNSDFAKLLSVVDQKNWESLLDFCNSYLIQHQQPQVTKLVVPENQQLDIRLSGNIADCLCYFYQKLGPKDSN